MPSLAAGKTTTWDKNQYSRLSFDWAGPAGSGTVSVKIGEGAATSYSVPQANLAIDRTQKGKLTNNTDKTINYTLSSAALYDADGEPMDEGRYDLVESDAYDMDDMDALAGVQYTLVFKNNSSNLGDACVYQTAPPSSPNVMSLAWFSKTAYPTTTVKFNWSIDYSFVWSETGLLVPGVLFTASQVWAADLTTTNQVTFTKENNAYRFKDQTQGPNAGSLLIKETNTIPLNQASVGIGMSGAGTFVQQAQPNWNLTFTPKPRYWITFGSFIAGEVLDVQSISNPAEIAFPANVYSMTATLNADNSWTIEPTSTTNARIATAQTYDKSARFSSRTRLF